MSVRKPILIGGIGLSFVLWVGSSIGNSLSEFGSELGLLGVLGVGAIAWWGRRRGSPALPVEVSASPVDRAAVAAEIERVENGIAALEAEGEDVSPWRDRASALPQGWQRQQLRVAVTGAKGTGKTCLRAALSSRLASEVTVVETEPLPLGSEADIERLDSDLVAFLTEGDITESEYRILQQLRSDRTRVVVVFNKQDRYPPEERISIWQQLRQRLHPDFPESDIVAISANPNPIEVRQQQADGTLRIWEEKPEPNVKMLSDRLETILASEREQLLCTAIAREARALLENVKGRLNQRRRERALPIVERYQWIAGTAAFANPVATLDLLATAAANAQMIVDLASIYQQRFSWEQAKTMAGALGKFVVQLGVVELSTQTAGAMLKTHALTYVAGGAVQGVSTAYLTHLVGLSAIEYFQEQEIGIASESGLNLDRLRQTLRSVWQRERGTAFWRGFVSRALERLPLGSENSPAIASES